MKRIVVLTMAVLFVFALASAAFAAAEYPGYYVSTGYDETGKGKISDNADGLPAEYVAHVELRADGTYEALLFGGLASGIWEIMKTPKGNEYVGLKIIKTVDKKHYPKGTLFMLVRSHAKGDNFFWLMQTDSDERMSMEKRPGKFDFDKVVGEIKKHYSGEK